VQLCSFSLRDCLSRGVVNIGRMHRLGCREALASDFNAYLSTFVCGEASLSVELWSRSMVCASEEVRVFGGLRVWCCE
jgi:hypothetical protein